MFEKYKPIDNIMFQIMDNEGVVHKPDEMPQLESSDIIKAYKDMLFARIADNMAVSFQRQGRMFTYPLNYGQEAISIAAGMQIKNDDWLVPAFRELGAYLAKGATLTEIFLTFMGNEEGYKFKNAKNLLPLAVPIASQLLHAVGIGYSLNIKKQQDVVFAFVGDGGTSTGDFNEALNFAGVWNVPVVFIIQNNQYAISVPLRKQTNSPNLAMRGTAFGMEAIKVDGNDFFAMYQAVKMAKDHARNGKGPVLIEAVTYRKGAHTTSDDPTKYRTLEEEERWDKTDPLRRLKLYLEKNNLWNINEPMLIEEFKKEVERQFEEAEKQESYKLDDVFDYTFADMPDELIKQKASYAQFLKWKEGRK